MSVVFITTGHTHLGMTKTDKAGNVIEKIPARFEYEPGGPCVIVGEMDPKDMEVKEDSVSIYADWQAAEYLEEILERLSPARRGNIPNLKFIVQKAYEEDGCDLLCDYCPDINCRDCIVKEWREEIE